MNDKFTSTKKAKRLRERIDMIYDGRPCDLIVTFDGKLAKKTGSGVSYIVGDADEYLDRKEREIRAQREKTEKILKQKIKTKLPMVVLSGFLVMTAITGLVELKKEADYNDWKVEQIVKDGGTTRMDRDGTIYGVPKKGSDQSKYSKESYKEYKKAQKDMGR